jgi:hypothetical protein
MKFRVLKIIDNLISIDVSLLEYKDETKNAPDQIYDSCVANILYSFAKKSIQSNSDYILVKTTV